MKIEVDKDYFVSLENEVIALRKRARKHYINFNEPQTLLALTLNQKEYLELIAEMVPILFDKVYQIMITAIETRILNDDRVEYLNYISVLSKSGEKYIIQLTEKHIDWIYNHPKCIETFSVELVERH